MTKKNTPQGFRIGKILFYLFLAFILIHILVYALQEKFIFLEQALHPDYHFNFSASNSEQVDFEEHFFSLENGDKINGLYFKTNDSIKGHILYFHGNAGNLSRWGNYATRFTDRGYNILMIDYHGYGKSDGQPGEFELYKDGQIAYDWLSKKTASQDIIIYGRSLGSAVACHTALNNPAKVLLLETPFNNIKDVVQTRFPFLFLKIPFRHRFPNDEKLQRIDYPIHIFHGTKDRVVPLACAKKLQPLLKSNDQFHTIESAGHNNLVEFSAFNEALDTILR